MPGKNKRPQTSSISEARLFETVSKREWFLLTRDYWLQHGKT